VQNRAVYSASNFRPKVGRELYKSVFLCFAGVVTDHFSGRIEHSVVRVCVCLSVFPDDDDNVVVLVQLDLVEVKLVDQGRRSKFKVTRGKCSFLG